ncbi:DEAD/DEAH box helicase [Cryobacterium sp. BB307]|uniref:DEAD/DEAH box helicase n=1 Tax=Cryobacterium sp. BB307 TaxID=2716317 RepID=UPI001447C6AF|nr:DEAD/DEAH box helicase [Cryobacterium sp. BB307]
MPGYKKSTAPARGTAARKAGSKSPKHRGYRPEAEAPRGGKPAKGATAAKKSRWTPEQRADRGHAPARPRGERTEQRAERTDRRPDWTPRSEQRGDRRPDWTPRSEQRSERGDRRPDWTPRGEQRTERGDRRPDWTPRGERPAREQGGRVRDDRPRYERSDRPQSGRRFEDDRPRRDDRPRYEDRPNRDERPRYEDRPSRDERPRYEDRPRRDERPRYEDHPRRDERPRYEDRPRRDSSFYPDKTAERFTAHEDVVLEKLEADAIQATDVEGVTFAALGLGGNITRALDELGATSPFPIQAATIPFVLQGRDVLGRGKTGSGKTIAFGAPLVERLMENGGGKKRQQGRKPRALILAPTRELALQIDRTVQPIARSVGLFTTQIYGGVPQHRQVTALQRGVDIIIGTPGRIEDLIDQGRLDLSEITITVLDEADHMCDLGFLEPVQRIIRQTADGGQKLLYSATLDTGVAALVDEFLVDPSVHEVAGEDQASSTIDHRVLLIDQREKRDIIEQLASGAGKTLIFARTRAFAEQLADDLDDAGIPAVSLHGDLNQARRTRNLEKLTNGRVKVLVATDVAARGIHVDDISLVIQADPPDEYKSYLHRAGRTGRAGKPGTVVTLVNARRRRKMDDLLKRAEISPSFDHVAPGDVLLGDLAAL